MANCLTQPNRKCAPRLSADAADLLGSHFVGLRKQIQQVERDNNERSAIPITIRSVSLALVSIAYLIK
jgi:DNA replication licensing factor MCM5